MNCLPHPSSARLLLQPKHVSGNSVHGGPRSGPPASGPLSPSAGLVTATCCRALQVPACCPPPSSCLSPDLINLTRAAPPASPQTPASNPSSRLWDVFSLLEADLIIFLLKSLPHPPAASTYDASVPWSVLLPVPATAGPCGSAWETAYPLRPSLDVASSRKPLKLPYPNTGLSTAPSVFPQHMCRFMFIHLYTPFFVYWAAPRGHGACPTHPCITRARYMVGAR